MDQYISVSNIPVKLVTKDLNMIFKFKNEISRNIIICLTNAFHL